MVQRIAPRGLSLLLLVAVLACPQPAAAEGGSTSPLPEWHDRLLGNSPPPSPNKMRHQWLSPAWPFRLKITARPESLAGGAELIDFPLLLPLTSSTAATVFAYAKPDGSDLVVTEEDGCTVLDREIVSYDAAGQSAEIWFRADTLSPDRHTFYLYYGNPDTSLVAADGQVWKPDYLGVYHFADDPGLGLLGDYGQHGNHAIPMDGWTSADTISGAIGRGWRFNGTTHWIDGDALASPDSSFTISAWFGLWNQAEGTDFAFQVEHDNWHLSAMRNSSQRNPDIANPRGFISWHPNPLPDTLLHNFVWTLDGVNDTTRFYFDGEEQDIRYWYAPNAPYKVYTGSPIEGNVGIAGPCFYNGQDHLTGIGDEFRVYQGVQVPEWILTEHRNQASGAGFYIFEEQTSVDVPESIAGIPDLSILRIFPSPAAGPVNIELQMARPLVGNIQIFDIGGRLIRSMAVMGQPPGLVHQSWDGRGADGRSLQGGIYFIRARAGATVLEKRIVLIP